MNIETHHRNPAAAMGVIKTENISSTHKSSNTSPKLVEAWIEHQERLKYIQAAQQQALYQQQMATALRTQAEQATMSASSHPAAQHPAALMFNLYYQVGFVTETLIKHVIKN